MDKSSAALLEQLRPFGIDPATVTVIDGSPWLNADQLGMIARASGEFQSISTVYDRRDNQEVIYLATVTDKDGRNYSRTGVATDGEKLPNGVNIKTHALAETRALRAALDMAGFNPLKGGSVVHLGELRRQPGNETARRGDQLKTIHALAEEKGLIVRDADGKSDRSGYRAWLEEEFEVTTSAMFTEEQFAVAIHKLRKLPNAA